MKEKQNARSKASATEYPLSRQVKKYEINSAGITPVIWNRMKREIELEKKKIKKNELEEYEVKYWLKKAEINDGYIVFPQSWFRSNLIESCKGLRLVPHWGTSKETFTRYMQNITIPINTPIVACKTEEIEQHGGYYKARPGSQNSGKVWKVFPILKKWTATFYVVDPIGRMKLAELKQLLQYGGIFIGIGDQRKDGYGRFEITSVKEVVN